MLPSLAKTSRTVPPRVATMSFCIFMASSTTTTSPRRTLSPGATLTLTTMPCMGAWIAPLPPAALAADGAATAARGAPAASPGTPSARIRTRYGSPSTSTVNSRAAGGGVAGGSDAATGAGAATDSTGVAGGSDAATGAGAGTDSTGWVG